MNKTSTLVLALVVLLLGFLVYRFNAKNNEPMPVDQSTKQDFSHDGTYVIEGQKVTLVNGISEVPASPDSATKIVTKYVGNDVQHDLDADGRMDTVFIITTETGGSGIYYYVVALLYTADGPVGSNGFLLFRRRWKNPSG